MSSAIEVNNLTKQYEGFLLDSISFTVPSGFVCGLIGQNGSGKTTVLKLMLGIAIKDSGDISLMGKPHDDKTVKADLGVLFDQPYYYDHWTPLDIKNIYSPFYSQWNSARYYNYLSTFGVDTRQRSGVMSRGTKMKLGLAVALSHNASLIILDEPTSGLDPVFRDEMLEVLQDYIADEGKTVFFSTHITSDLDKIADYIVYVHKGRIVFNGLKDELIERYCLIRGSQDDLELAKSRGVIGLREHIGGFEGLLDSDKTGGFTSGSVIETATLSDIMVHISKEVAVQ